MPLRDKRRPRRLPFSRIALFFLAFLTTAGSTRAQEFSLESDSAADQRIRSYALIVGGAHVDLNGKGAWQPQLAGRMGLPHAWQLGLEAQMEIPRGGPAYDMLPEVDVQIRKLWLGDERIAPERHAEYFSLNLGGYFAYDFDGSHAGPRPFAGILMGKYWAPWEEWPIGLDLNIGITGYFFGHRPRQTDVEFLSAGVNVFYALPTIRRRASP